MDDLLGDRAKALRRAGLTINEIKAALGITSNRRISAMLQGEPPTVGVRGRKAKRDAQAKARDLRALGWSYNAIAAELGVAKSSVSVWCQDVVLTEAQRAALQLPVESVRLKRAESLRAGRIRRTEVIHAAAAAEIGQLTDRELFLIGVALYWAEGTKQKPWSPSTRVHLINSDPAVVLVFLRWLAMLGVERDRLVLTLSIHESADVERARTFWARLLDVDPRLIRAQLKRHNPKTKRHNTGDSYVGALVVTVRRSTDLNRRIEGWWLAIAAAACPLADDR